MLAVHMLKKGKTHLDLETRAKAIKGSDVFNETRRKTLVDIAEEAKQEAEAKK